MNCKDCKYSQVIVEKGQHYTMLNPVGDEITRLYEDTIMICRWAPPISGSWPQVGTEDYCGKFEPYSGA